MKKLLFLLLFSFFFFLPKDTFAFSGQFHVNSMAVYKDDRLTNATSNFNTWNSGGNQYWVIPSNSSDISALHINVDNYFSYEVPFDVSFQLVWSGYNYDEIAGGNYLGTDKGSIEFKKPIVQFAGVTCDVHTQGLVFNSGSIMNVKCEKVSTNDSKPTISAWFSTIDASDYGISKSFNWYQSSNITKGDMDELVQSQKDTQEAIKKQTEETKKQTDTIKDSDTTGAKDTVNGFFGDFKEEDFGFSDVLTAPLVFFRNLLGHSCDPLKFQMPIIHDEVTLPCIKPIYQQYFGLFFNLYQTITTGVIAYWVIIRIWATVKGLQDPQNDKIEVFKL